MQERIQRKENSHTLLVGMQTGTDTVYIHCIYLAATVYTEHSIELSQKTKHRVAI